MIRRFWWGKGDQGRGIDWRKWDMMCLPKVDGGLGFKELEAFNFAFLSKQGWRLLKKPNSLVARVLKAKYHPIVDFLEAKARSGILLYGGAF